MFGIFERAGAYELFIGRVGHDVTTREDMLRQHCRQRRQGIADKLEGRRLGEMENGSEVVWRFNLFQRLEHNTSQVLQRFPDFHGRKCHIRRCERRAVMPFDAFAQVERRRQPVGRTFPARGKPWRETIFTFERRFRQRLDHLACDEENAIGRNDGGVQIARF